MSRLCWFSTYFGFLRASFTVSQEDCQSQTANQSLKDVRPPTFTSIARFTYIRHQTTSFFFNFTTSHLPLFLPPPSHHLPLFDTFLSSHLLHVVIYFFVDTFGQSVSSCSHRGCDHWSRYLVHLSKSTTTIAFFLILKVGQLQPPVRVAASTSITLPISTAVNGKFCESFHIDLVSLYGLRQYFQFISTVENIRFSFMIICAG